MKCRREMMGLERGTVDRVPAEKQEGACLGHGGSCLQEALPLHVGRGLLGVALAKDTGLEPRAPGQAPSSGPIWQ